VRGVPEVFNSLSRDHPSLRDREKTRFFLFSTPSLGITRAIRVVAPRPLDDDFSTPSLGITRVIRTKEDWTVGDISTPSLGITRDEDTAGAR
jgi:hypothetical protein